MATLNYTGYSQGSGSVPTSVPNYDVGTAMPYAGLEKLGIKKATVDTSKTGISNTNADVYEAIYIPAGMKVLDAWFVVTTPETGNVLATFALGDNSTTNGYVTAAVCTSVAVHATNASTYANTGGKTYTSANTIDLLVATAAFTNCVVDVYALVLDMNA